MAAGVGTLPDALSRFTALPSGEGSDAMPNCIAANFENSLRFHFLFMP
jgi:hypothetical protein